MATTEYGGSIYLGPELGWVKREYRYSRCPHTEGHFQPHGIRTGGANCCGHARYSFIVKWLLYLALIALVFALARAVWERMNSEDE